MGLSIIPIGGYGEVGKNCTAVKVDDDIFLLDLGIHLENYIRLSEEDDLKKGLSKELLLKENAVPDISIIDAKKVKGIIISHAHLDHVGAVPYLANNFDCDVHVTPFTAAFLEQHISDKRKELHGDIIRHDFKKRFRLTDKVEAELVEVTHSTPQSAIIILYTPYGNVVYINDFKLDPTPMIGSVTDLEYVAKSRPKALILDTLYADVDKHVPSERFAHELLERALISRDLKGRNIIVTTFASQIARISGIIRLAEKMNRKVMIVGRSMAKYLQAAKESGVSDIIDKQEVIRYGSKVKRVLSKVDDHRDYIFVVTGGMGEPNAVLTRMLDEELVPIKRKDLVVFSNRLIPTPTIIKARDHLERKIQGYGLELLKDLHVSGHGAGKDMEEVLRVLKPEVVIPVHSEDDTRQTFKRIAGNIPVKILHNGEELLLS